ncbi:MAG: uroporphyrinogen-III C-methyltransferase [Polyangiaceae bacterium]
MVKARAGTVYLVGAGPGDPELVTVRGRDLLREADAILHDELAPRALLALARPGALVEYVGKRGREPAAKQLRQSAIDERLVELAREGKSVVRLKGGDPYLFGRGSEEAEALAAAGVRFEVVPGVTSAVGASAYAGVSLTHRDFASSVVFVSATTRKGAPFDFRELAGVRGSLAIFMGLGKVASIAESLIRDAGRPAETPVMIVSGGTRPDQLVVEGTLADIAERAAHAPLFSPALVVVGEVVRLRSALAWFDRQPLFGKRVLVTRAAHQAEGVTSDLLRRGAQPIELPLIEFGPPPDPGLVTEAVNRLSTYDLVAFTSENGVDRFFEAISSAGRDARAFGRATVAAIGDGTARALARHGVRADLVPTAFHGDALAAAVLERLQRDRGGAAAGARVLIPRALVAREALPGALAAAGCTVEVVPVYETRRASRERADELREWLGRGAAVDVVLLTSSSIADALVDLLGGDLSAQTSLASVTLASIGHITTETARRHGLNVAVTATTSTMDGLLDALESHYLSRNRSSG